ncbi:MAG: hypothetical protein ABJA78_08240 [Ferruginibacter sp.]
MFDAAKIISTKVSHNTTMWYQPYNFVVIFIQLAGDYLKSGHFSLQNEVFKKNGSGSVSLSYCAATGLKALAQY